MKRETANAKRWAAACHKKHENYVILTRLSLYLIPAANTQEMSSYQRAIIIRPLHSSSNIVVATHAHYIWSHVENKMAAEFCKFTKSYGPYPSHNTLHAFTLLGLVSSVCTELY